MKNYINIILFIALIGFSSCGDELTDLNVNPSFPSDVPSISLVANIQQEMARGIQFDTRFIGKYVQYFSEATAGNPWDQHGYVANSDAGGEIWRMVYFGQGQNLSNLISKSEEEKRYDILGFGKVMRAWGYQTATDYHGELIAFDQLFIPRLTYDFDSQERAYKEVVKLADEGIASLSRSDGFVNQAFFARADLIYNGDRSRWTKFAYGVKARNLNSQVNKGIYTTTLAAQVIQFCDLSLASPADDATIKFNGSIAADSNFFGPTRNNILNFRQTDFLIRSLNGTIFTGVIDPRLGRITVPSVGGSETLPATAANPNILLYTHNGNALNTAAATTGTNRIPNLWGTFTLGSATVPGRYLFRDRAEFPVMTYTEIQFIKAEAAFRLGNFPLALDAYRKGINASFDLVNRNTIQTTTFPITTQISAAERATYLANPAVVPAVASNLTLSQIMMQKYIALFGFGTMETWVDMRKYRYDPLVYPTLTVATNGFFPDNGGQKFAYRVRPRFNSEYVWNFAALQALGADARDYHTKEMWFMQP